MKSNFPAIASDGYQIADRRAYIRRLCTMLGISGPSRIDRAFREQVISIQVHGGLAASGVVDYATYLLILEQYRRSSTRAICLYDTGDDISRLNTDLSRLVVYYELPVRRPRGRIFGVDGMRAAMLLRKIYGLPDSNNVDGDLLRAIERDIRSINAISR